MSDAKTFTSLHMETVMTLWEYIHQDVTTDETTDLYKYYLNTGMSQLRYDIIHKLAEQCQEVYDIVSELDSYDCVSWDIEFIPAYLSTVEWNERTGIITKPTEEIVKELTEYFGGCQ